MCRCSASPISDNWQVVSKLGPGGLQGEAIMKSIVDGIDMIDSMLESCIKPDVSCCHLAVVSGGSVTAAILYYSACARLQVHANIHVNNVHAFASGARSDVESIVMPEGASRYTPYSALPVHTSPYHVSLGYMYLTQGNLSAKSFLPQKKRHNGWSSCTIVEWIYWFLKIFKMPNKPTLRQVARQYPQACDEVVPHRMYLPSGGIQPSIVLAR